MTTAEYIKEMEERYARLAKGEHVFTAISDVHTKMGERIFNDGLDSNNQEIGVYNTKKPIRVNVELNNLPKKPTPRGFRDGEITNKKVDGSDYKTSYFKSYSQLRSEQVGRNSKVDLSLTTLLESDFYSGLVPLSNTVWVAQIKNENNYNKAIGNEKRFKKVIFKHTKEEEAMIVEKVQFETIRIMRGL